MRSDMDQDLKRRAKKVLPDGVYGHESTKLLPESYPQFFSRAKGAYLWDADGNKYLDLMCAYGPNLLGYGDERVDAAALAQSKLGDAMTGPAPVMVELAETMVGMVAHADWAMFCKNGTDATTMAKTIARAQTGKRIILVATGAYHGAMPWCTPLPAGVIPEDRAHIQHYDYNSVESLEAAVSAAGDDLAAIFATPFKHDAFTDQAALDLDYARRARALCDQTGAMLIVDDVRAGFRLTRDCSWELVGVRPDLSTWGKSFANGYPISALLGSDRARDGAASIYATGSFWFAAVPMAAAIETLRILRDTEYLEHMIGLGDYLRAGLHQAAHDNGFGLRQTGPVQMPLFLFEDDPDFRVGFAWSEAMLKRGVYVHPWHNMFLCDAMTQSDMDLAIAAASAAFQEVRERYSSLQPHALLAQMFSARAAE
ncbi:MAG: aminotransferase class III-fold pyridoxal phosphate-dependent enzyme [Hyphomonadaceae bacterium]|nr:aminotransferase class III-fold pyridoxal phosphate-dependent enzyme [Hyphomonadaceae bacterium]